MSRYEGKLAALLQALGSFIASYWTSLPSVTNLLVFLVIVDYSSGLIAAMVRGELSSHKGWRGIIKKILIFVSISVAHEISKPLGLGGDIGAAFALFYCANEAISIFENLAKVGVPMPSGLMETLAKVRGKSSFDEPKN